MDLMTEYPDKYFDLAIVDPPYGGKQDFNFRFGNGDQVFRNEKPDIKYFKELFRISKNQIIWGANYFADMLPINRCWISWYKGQPVDNFSDFELAYTSFDQVSKAINLKSYGSNHADVRMRKEKTIHPTQKPIALYRWLLENYAKPGDLILDTHVGSASSLIACESLDFDYAGCEIDKDYYEEAKKRIEKWRSLPLFDNHKSTISNQQLSLGVK
jgi:site-specific DNA-methyltransferase (adenine-specific)